MDPSIRIPIFAVRWQDGNPIIVTPTASCPLREPNPANAGIVKFREYMELEYSAFVG
jgi:hypothetical protein